MRSRATYSHDNFPSHEVRKAICDLFISNGLSADHASDVADVLVYTSLIGIDTHGVRLVPTYLRELREGRAKACPTFAITNQDSAVAVFDADDALGAVAANAAMREAIRRALRHGIAAVAVANSNHFGAAGYYARMAAAEDQIGIVCSNSDALVTPADGVVPLNGTNPIAVAAPALRDDGFFLDMATSEVSYSSLVTQTEEVDTNERISTARKTVPPLGGYKGQGLGMLVQVLCALLSDMPLDAELKHLYSPPFDAPRKVSHLLIAIDIKRFVAPARFKERLSSLLNAFRESPSRLRRPIWVAGDREALEHKTRMSDGIPLGPVEIELLADYLH